MSNCFSSALCKQRDTPRKPWDTFFLIFKRLTARAAIILSGYSNCYGSSGWHPETGIGIADRSVWYHR